MKKVPRISKKFLLGSALWFIALIAVLTITYWIPGISGALTATYVAQYDTVFASDKVECYLVKTESISYAENSGSISYSAEEGHRVRTYTGVVKIGDTVYTTTQPGIISYTADGYENYFIEDNIVNITKKSIQDFDIVNKNLVKETVQSGDPLFKVIDDKNWYFLFWIDKDSIKDYSSVNKVEVILDETHKVSANINKIYEQENEYMVVLETNEYYENLATTRVVEAEVIRVNESGLLVEQKSIVTVDGNPGVYVKQINGEYKFVRVKILSLVAENAIVAADSFNEVVDDVTNNVTTIKVYDEILRNAKSVSEGGEKK